MKIVTEIEFNELVGRLPEQDDLERVNCEQAGTRGHSSCGLCKDCGYPNFIPKFNGTELVCSHPDTRKDFQ